MIFVKKRAAARLAPVFQGANSNSAAVTITTTVLAGQFMLYWETANSLSMPPLTSGYTSILQVSSDGASNDFCGHLQWRIADIDNRGVPRPTLTGRAVVCWYSNVDPVAPIIEAQPKSSNTAVSGVALPALAAFPYPSLVAAAFRMFSTATVDATAAGLIERRTQSAASAEAVMADSDVPLASWPGATATTSEAQQHVAAVCALRGAAA